MTINLKWDQKFELGHQRIDNEHRVFLSLIIDASTMGETTAPKDRALRLLAEVKKYAEFHFLSEENIMIDVDYPDYEHHKAEHARLLARLDDKIHLYTAGSKSLTDVANFMFEWFALHTTQIDKKLASYIQQSGQS